MTIRQKAIAVTAEQFVGQPIEGGDCRYLGVDDRGLPFFQLEIQQDGGYQTARMGDWVVADARGRRFVVKADAFDAAYTVGEEIDGAAETTADTDDVRGSAEGRQARGKRKGGNRQDDKGDGRPEQESDEQGRGALEQDR